MLRKKLKIASGRHAPKLAKEHSADAKGIANKNMIGKRYFFI